MPTHDVLNQPPPLVDIDLYVADPGLAEAVGREGAAGATDGLGEIGRRAGGAEAAEWGRLANANPPILRSHDCHWNRIGEVEYHPPTTTAPSTAPAASSSGWRSCCEGRWSFALPDRGGRRVLRVAPRR